MLFINKNSLPKMDMYVKDLILSGEYSLFTTSSNDKYYVQISANDLFELTSEGEVVKKVSPSLPGLSQVYFENAMPGISNSVMQNFCGLAYR